MTPVCAMDLVLDPYRVPEVCARVTQTPELLRPFDRIHILVFSNGQLAGPGRCEPFGNLADEPALTLTRLARAQGKSVAWGFDLLRWERTACPPTGLRQRIPDWLEVDAGNRPLTADGNAFASPWEPRAAAALQHLVDTVARWEPQPDALDLCCRLSGNTLIGYSQQAREAAIRAIQLDPVDFRDLREGGPVREVWAKWREDTLTALFADLSRRYHAQQPRVALFGWNSGTYLNASMNVRILAADYGPRLVKEGLVQGVLLDAQWAAAPGMWRFAQQVVPASAGEPRPVRAIVAVRDGDSKPRFAEALAALIAQGASLADMIAYPLMAQDLDLVGAVLGYPTAQAAKPQGAPR